MDWIWLGILVLGLIIIIFFAEIVRKRFHWTIKATRKFVHIFTGILIALTPFLITASFPLLIICGVFMIVNFVAIKQNWMPGMHATEQKSYGTVFYPLSFFILILLLWHGYKTILVIAMLIMALADAGAAIVGENVKTPKIYQFSGEKKSVQGSLTMFFASFLITALGLKFLGGIDELSLSVYEILWYALIVTIIATACESISYKGSDNLSVPLGAAFVAHFLVTHPFSDNVSFTIGVMLALLIAVLSFKAKFLSGSGAVATFLLGAVVFGIGKWEFSLPLLLFFILSSLLSKLGKKQKLKFKDTFQKGGQRDLGQVLANGGIAGILVLLWNFFPNDVFYFAFVGSIAAVTADTWGTEIGVFSRSFPRNIINFKKVAPGASGGVSLLGTLGGLAGSVTIVFLGKLVTSRYDSLSLSLALFIVFAGVFGSVIDSIMGATLQAQYRCIVCGKATEKKVHCNGLRTSLVAGFKAIDNDVVNAVCALAGAVFACVAYLAFI